MPYATRKLRNKECYKVYNPKSKKVFSKCSTKQNAVKQLRLLRALQFNKNFVFRPRNKTTKKRTNA
jgi:hypothetical protein